MERALIIAECGINHNGSLDTAKALAHSAKESGADVAKFQTYQTDKRVPADSPIYDILKRCEISYDDQFVLAKYCKDIGIEFCSTPFDSESLDFLTDQAKVKRVKVASFDVTNKTFLNEINQKCLSNPDLEVIMSAGMANEREVNAALMCLERAESISLLHCISSYPTPDSEVNLRAIRGLGAIAYPNVKRLGYSDHTSGVHIPALSVLAGARVIEKHFTLDLAGDYVDNPVSADPKMMKAMVQSIRNYEQLLGDGKVEMKEVEKAALAFRRTS